MTAPTMRRINYDVNVKHHRLAADTDQQSLQRAINIARAAPDKKRIILPVDCAATAGLDVAGLNGMVIEAGDPYRTKQPATLSTGPGLNYTTGAVQDLTIPGLGVRGRGVDDVASPRRARTCQPGIG